ncbi:MAG: hypothetical protein PHW96_04220 [Candidatus Nanoarchaeia archaeon]|nr:hypothetical protein [Candidatus Nanoarchaeia archaeon]
MAKETKETKETKKEEVKIETKEEKPDVSDSYRPNFETMKSFDKTYGEGDKKFIEITLKKVNGEEGTEFISISKGYFGFNGRKIYRRSMGFPYTDELKKFVVESINKL